MIADVATMARYNAWANKELHAACATLRAEDYHRPRGAFFGSIHGTLNHIYLVDVLYRDRLEKRRTRIKRLDEILCDALADLSAAQADEDRRYIDIMEAMSEQALDGPFGFHTIPDNQYWELPLRICLGNLYQHQIHHRGQTHDMITQAGYEAPPLDYIHFRLVHE